MPERRGSVVVSTSACHAGGRGSIPGPDIIYTIILSVCRRSQTVGRNSCSIVSGYFSNFSYRLTVHPVTSSRLSLA